MVDKHKVLVMPASSSIFLVSSTAFLVGSSTAALCDAAEQAFYNTSKFTLRDLKSRGSQQQLLADFEDYLNGFSPNVEDILDNFKFHNQLSTLSKTPSAR